MQASIRNIYTLSFIFFCSISAYTQTAFIDSLKKIVATQKEDTNKVWTLKSIGDYYVSNDPDSSIIYVKQALILAEKLHFDKGIFWSFQSLDNPLYITGNYTLELDYALRAFQVAKKLNDQDATSWSNGMLAGSYLNLGDYNTAMIYIRVIFKNREQNFPDELFSFYAALVPVYVGLH